MEEEAKLGELVLKLEKYRYNVLMTFSWPIFGMIFGSAALLLNSAYLIGKSLGFEVPPHVWLLMIIAGLASGLVFGKMMKYAPYKERVWRRTVITMMTPFIVAYAIPANPFYYTTVWYPALGVALLLTGLLVERRSEYLVASPMTVVGTITIATSPILLMLSRLPTGFETLLAAGLICTAMMLINYLIGALYGLHKAQRVVYGA
jgi:hypothetical protein